MFDCAKRDERLNTSKVTNGRSMTSSCLNCCNQRIVEPNNSETHIDKVEGNIMFTSNDNAIRGIFGLSTSRDG